MSLDEHGDVVLDTVVQGDTVREVLDYVQYNSQTLLDAFPQRCGDAPFASSASATKNPAAC